jgi:hypothetical protein
MATAWLAGMRVTAARLNAANPTFVSATLRQTSTQTILDNTTTALLWAAEDQDTNGGHDTVTNNSRWYVPLSGRYLLTCIIYWPANNTTGGRRLSYRVDGNLLTLSGDNRTPMPSGTPTINALSRVMRLNLGSYVEAVVIHTAGVSQDLTPANGESGVGQIWTIDYLGPL